MSNIPSISNILKQSMQRVSLGDNRCKFVPCNVFNSYYEGFLNNEDANLLLGMKFAIDDCSDAFGTLEDAKGFEFTNFDISKVDNAKLDAFINGTYDPFENEEDKDDLSLLSNETKIIMIIYRHIIEMMADSRNDVGVSMIDDMNDEEHEKNIKNFFEKKDLNVLEIRKDNVDDEDYQKNRAKQITEAKELYEKEKQEESDF